MHERGVSTLQVWGGACLIWARGTMAASRIEKPSEFPIRIVQREEEESESEDEEEVVVVIEGICQWQRKQLVVY